MSSNQSVPKRQVVDALQAILAKADCNAGQRNTVAARELISAAKTLGIMTDTKPEFADLLKKYPRLNGGPR